MALWRSLSRAGPMVAREFSWGVADVAHVRARPAVRRQDPALSPDLSKFETLSSTMRCRREPAGRALSEEEAEGDRPQAPPSPSVLRRTRPPKTRMLIYGKPSCGGLDIGFSG